VRQISEWYVYDVWDGQALLWRVWLSKRSKANLNDVIAEHRSRLVADGDGKISQN